MDSINFQLSKYAALLDTNVLYPSLLRDIVLRLASKGTFRAHWSEETIKELRSTLAKKAKLGTDKIDYVVEQMDNAFPDALVSGYGTLLPKLSLPDKNDVHVVAAAVRARCDVIVTLNTSDFPEKALTGLDIDVQHPDEFLNHHLSLERDLTLQVVKEHFKELKNPPILFDDYLRYLGNAGLAKFPNALKEAEALIV